MNIPKSVIEKALENGWRSEDLTHFRTRMVRPDEKIIVHVSEWNGIWYADFAGAQWPLSEIALDPTFWQAINRYKKWDQPIWDCHKIPDYKNASCDNTEFCEYAGWRNIDNLRRDFLDRASSGGGTAAFWAELIPDEK